MGLIITWAISCLKTKLTDMRPNSYKTTNPPVHPKTADSPQQPASHTVTPRPSLRPQTFNSLAPSSAYSWPVR